MAENGYYIYAGARKQEDLDALNAIDSIRAIRIDVTKQEEIDVADVTLQALSDQPMARRYLVVPNETEMDWVMDNMVDRLADLNRNNRFAWTPEKIATEVEAAIAQKGSQQVSSVPGIR